MNAVVRLNLDVKKNEIDSSLRIRMAAASLKELVKKFDRIVILSHRGRPVGHDVKLSLYPVVKNLSERLHRKIFFLDGPLDKCLERVSGKRGVFTLENTRFFPGESRNSVTLARSFASFGDIFVNDDFATAHRAHASNVGIVGFITGISGPILRAELESLKKAAENPAKPFILIVGGAKMSSKLQTIKNLLPKSDYVLLGGGVGNTFLKAEGYDIGDSICENNLISEAKRLIKNPKVVYPSDFRVSKKQILDIGPNTASYYADIISKSKTVVWAGPLGFFEKKEFSKGTETVARAIASTNCFSVAGGGETTSAIIKFGLEKKFSFLSTGGGAMLEFLSGNKLPALEALRIKYRRLEAK